MKSNTRNNEQVARQSSVITECSINESNYNLLKKLFPHAVSINEDGKYAINTQKLQMSLDPSIAEITEVGYGLNWVGKKEAYHNAFTKNYKILKPVVSESKNWNETNNVLIKGDNLDTLKILRHNYFELIKMIYIDPPYNTKNDGFVYNDNFTASTEHTLEELGYDKEYIEYIENIHGAKTHSGWLNFMFPRLLLAKDLLTDDGVIFISIDDNEINQLKMMCDEIFGEQNVEIYIWDLADFEESSFTKTASHTVRAVHEYIIACYKSQKKLGRFKEYRLRDKDLSNVDNDPRGDWFSGNISRNGIRSTTGSKYYKIVTPSGAEFERNWTMSQEQFEENVKKNNIYFGKDGDGVPRLKMFKDELFDSIQDSIFTGCKTSITGRNQLNELFGKIHIFDFPKPTNLISRLAEISTEKDSIIMDFFAGSGTTGHATMDFNLQENSNRKFICVQIPEPTPVGSDARNAGYETVFDITKARIDKAGDKIINGSKNQTSIDIGFRIFEVVDDQQQKIYLKSLEQVSQDDLVELMEKPDIETNEEILYNLFVAEGLPLSTKHKELITDKLYLAANVAFILGDITSAKIIDNLKDHPECEYITVYSPNISDDKLTLELESNLSTIDIKPDKLRFRG